MTDYLRCRGCHANLTNTNSFYGYCTNCMRLLCGHDAMMDEATASAELAQGDDQ